VIAGLAIALGIAGLWAQRTLGDAETISALAGEILTEPRIRTELAIAIVDPVLERAPDAIQAQRAFILSTTESVLGHPRFVSVFQAVLRVAATELLEGRGAIRLDLDRPLELVIVEVEPVSPEAAAALSEIDAPSPVIVSAERADRLRDLIEFERAVSVALLVGGAALVLVAVVRGGPRALLPFGATLAGASLVLLAALLFGRTVLLAGIEPEGRADAARAAWNIVIADLRTALLIATGAGAVAVVAGGVLGRRAWP
jgi:hypothetical protein